MLSSTTVPTPNDVSAMMRIDATLAYLLFATVFLGGVALAGGVVRRDFRALASRSGARKVGLAVLAAVLITYAIDAAGWLAFPGGHPYWWPSGMYRAPLYLIGLAYGPTVAVAAGLAYLAIASAALGPDPASGVILLELVVLGWLSIQPSPARFHWAGPLNAALAYGLAWLTAGLVLLEVGSGSVSLAAITDQHRGSVAGLVVAMACLAIPTPSRYRVWFPESRIHGVVAADEG